MAAACLNRLVHTATAADHAKRAGDDGVLRRQELERGVDVAWHLLDHRLALAAEIGVLAAAAPAEATEVEGQHVVPRVVQHDRELVVAPAIGVALMEQQNAGTALGRRMECTLKCESVGGRNGHLALFGACRRGQKHQTDCERSAHGHRSRIAFVTSSSWSTRKPMFGVPISSQLWPP